MSPCFEEPKIKVSIFQIEDVITTSSTEDDTIVLPDVGMQ